MESAYFQSEFFGSGILWMLLTFPAYWLFQWCVEGETFRLWQRTPIVQPTPTAIAAEPLSALADSPASLST